MATPPILDFDALLPPIPGDPAAGRPVPLELTDQLNEARKEINPNDYDADDPTRPAQAKPADWRTIQRLTIKALTETSKDLLLGSRLTEAIVKQHGFAGLRDGLRLLRRLVTEGWDRVYPLIEEDGDLERRAGPFFWLDDADRGARFPSSVRMVPIVSVNGTTCSWHDWKRAQEGRGAVPLDEINRAMAEAPIELLQTAAQDADEAREELNQLVFALNEKMGREAPGLSSLRQALEESRGLVQMILDRRGGEMSAENATVSDGESVHSTSTGKAAAPASRDAAYRQLEQAAITLERIEPHSPVPYLIRRAVELGKLPFPQMIKALIREANVLAELNRELGIKEPSEEGN